MKPILNPSQIRESEKRTEQEQGLASIDLMERAAEQFVNTFHEIFPHQDKRPIVVFCGSGNNGGDGLSVARRLLSEGFKVSVYLFNTSNGLSENCAEEKRLLLANNTDLLSFSEVLSQFTPPHLDAQSIVIDALFGTGLNRPLGGGFAAVVKYINASTATVVSIDIPSGLMAEDNGNNISSHIIRADYTITFQAPKLSFLFPENENYVGDWRMASIGLSNTTDAIYHFVELPDIKEIWKPRSRFAHKGMMGHGLLVAGHTGMAGAAILSARSCLRSGVGKVSILTQEENRIIMQVSVPEAILSLVPELNFANLENIYDALAIGPGLGTDEQAVQILEALLSNLSQPLVLDADALNILSNHPDLLQSVPHHSILTPHKGELARLIGHTRNSYEELQRTLDFANKNQLYILIKGAFSAIVTPQRKVYFNSTGNAGMATAGSGDVLSGILLAFLAQGYSLEDTLRLGVYIHGLSGDIAAEEKTQTSLIASDIVNYLPKAFALLSPKI